MKKIKIMLLVFISLTLLTCFSNRAGAIEAIGDYPPTTPDEPSGIIAEWGGEGLTHGHFHAPCSIELDRSGQLYVGDLSGRIQKFTTDGTYLDTLNLEYYDGSSVIPDAFTIARDGHIFVIDSRYHRIFEFDSDGFIRSIGEDPSDSQFHGIAIDSHDIIFTTAAPHGSVFLYVGYSSESMDRRDWGRTGDRDGAFRNGPRDIAFDSSNELYAIDQSRVQVFSIDGGYLRGWRAFDLSKKCYSPAKIAIDSSDNIYILGFHMREDESFAESICVFNKRGEFLNGFEFSGSGRGAFRDSMAALSPDSIFLADYATSTVKKIKLPPGSPLDAYHLDRAPAIPSKPIPAKKKIPVRVIPK